METENILSNVRTASRPTELKITDMRIVRTQVGGPILKLYTNQDIYGLGEVRDGGSPTYALMLKSRLIGENPCNVDKVFRKIKQFGHHGRQGGGISGIEMALMDLAGKAYGVPCYQLAGGKFREKIRCYSDTPSIKDPEEMGHKLQTRIDKGFTFLKMDVGVGLLRGVEGTISAPEGSLNTHNIMHPFTGIRLTEKGIGILCEYVETVRNIIGYEIPLAVDHSGHIGIEDCIRLAGALEKYNLAWLEDMVPWQYTDQYVRLSNSCATPICTGEDIYCKEDFMPLFENRAIAICHPDIATSGGILETKKIGDLAEEHGIAMALHMAGTPVCAMASVHCAAATSNFLVLENHSVDNPWWDDMVTGLPNPIIQDGYIAVPETPGLGIDLNEGVIREHLHSDEIGYFVPTTEWDSERSHDRLWS
ncbi:mandelate racemase/muconate lactonizing enzyme family protein [Candidatus Poribacteria bacterium]|nr:mandelate racemase/muconate lactonizing enzyme family protein [Candidatus Poribacteria bacterium]MYB64388.1 mandelate racemase/muconate lactonizing enzyme family protein [Candidatus Poribacteria bacterium]MYF55256.1 mandelate racemase/muconate lactonizing enzyme family protein [Candidatus Poribacteria bacterium]MYI92923.1 mandelate racemase/muconate lactonizing enzyme family protein [Candidatus Poribacteria bacterium]